MATSSPEQRRLRDGEVSSCDGQQAWDVAEEQQIRYMAKTDIDLDAGFDDILECMNIDILRTSAYSEHQAERLYPRHVNLAVEDYCRMVPGYGDIDWCLVVNVSSVELPVALPPNHRATSSVHARMSRVALFWPNSRYMK